MKRTAALTVLVLALASCGGGTAVNDVEIGDCFNDPDSELVTTLKIVDCAEPHDNEVYAKTFLSESVWPGSDAVEELAFDACLTEFERYVGQSYAESSLDYFFLSPTEEGFQDGDITILCILYSQDLTKLTGSQRAG